MAILFFLPMTYSVPEADRVISALIIRPRISFIDLPFHQWLVVLNTLCIHKCVLNIYSVKNIMPGHWWACWLSSSKLFLQTSYLRWLKYFFKKWFDFVSSCSLLGSFLLRPLLPNCCRCYEDLLNWSYKKEL